MSDLTWGDIYDAILATDDDFVEYANERKLFVFPLSWCEQKTRKTCADQFASASIDLNFEFPYLGTIKCHIDLSSRKLARWYFGGNSGVDWMRILMFEVKEDGLQYRNCGTWDKWHELLKMIDVMIVKLLVHPRREEIMKNMDSHFFSPKLTQADHLVDFIPIDNIP